MKIKNAIIVHGPGRSGTTLLSSILSLHEDLGWISGYINKYPNILELAYLNKLQNNRAFEKFSRNKRRVPRPSEAYGFWTHYIPEFNTNTLLNLDEKTIAETIKAINKILKISNKERFITKLTGNSRWQTLDAVFESPTILWINRNPEAVIMSYYKNKWGYKDNLEAFQLKSKKELIKGYSERYCQYIKERKELERFNFFELQYEDLVKDKVTFFKDICDKTGLPYSPNFQSIITSWHIKTETNTAYLKALNEDEVLYLKSLVRDL